MWKIKKLQVLRVTNQKLRLMGTNAINQVLCTLWSPLRLQRCAQCWGCRNSESHGNTRLQVPSWTFRFTADCPSIVHNTIRSGTNYLLHLPCVDTTHTHLAANISWEMVSFVRFPFLSSGLFPSGPSCLVLSNMFSGPFTPLPEEPPRGQQVQSLHTCMESHSHGGGPEGYPEVCSGSLFQMPPPQVLRETPTPS